MHQLKYHIYLIFCTFLINACGSSTEQKINPSTPLYFVKAEKINELSADEIRGNLALLMLFDASFDFLNDYTNRLKYDVEAYKIIYKTTYLEGREIEASGLVILPKTSDVLSVFNYQHGTITSDSDAPSNFSLTSESTLISLPLASLGYMVVAPDYIGYGESNGFEHPYEHKALTASASRDMIRAAKEFAAQEGKNLNNKLYLTGYSQGGSAAMGLHELLETSHAGEFTVTASMPGAGAYNKLGFTKYILTQDEDLNFIDFYVWVLGSYNSIYNLNRPFNFYFTEPNASYLAVTPLNQININRIDTNPQNLFTQELRNGLLNETDQEFIAILNDNNSFDWRPQAPIIMFHGTADDFVPFFNAEDALQAMQARGANNVTLIPIEGGNHFSSISRYFEGVLNNLDQLQ